MHVTLTAEDTGRQRSHSGPYGGVTRQQRRGGGDNITHNTEKRITPGCNREDVSNTKSQPAARQCLLQEIGENRERRRGLKNRTRYSVSSHEEAGPICIHPCKPGTNNRGGSQTHMQPPRGPRSGRVNTQSMILSDAVKQACKHGQDTDKRVCRTSHSDVGTKTYDCKLKRMSRCVAFRFILGFSSWFACTV